MKELSMDKTLVVSFQWFYNFEIFRNLWHQSEKQYSKYGKHCF